MTRRGVLVTALILLGLGVERLLNLYLLGGSVSQYPVRSTVGVAGVVLGALFLVLTGYARLYARR